MSKEIWQEHNAPGTPWEQQCQCQPCLAHRFDQHEEKLAAPGRLEQLAAKISAALRGNE